MKFLNLIHGDERCTRLQPDALYRNRLPTPTQFQCKRSVRRTIFGSVFFISVVAVVDVTVI